MVRRPRDFVPLLEHEMRWLQAEVSGLPAEHDLRVRVETKLAEVAEFLRLVDGFPVVIAGEFSVGKSTLINRILGAPILPTGLSVTTSWNTRISWGPPDAIIHLPNGVDYTYSTRGRSRGGLQPNDPTPVSPVEPVGSARSPVSGNPDDLRDWLSRMSSTVVMEGSTVEVHWPSDFLKTGFVFLDTPGFNSEISAHRKQAHAALADAGCVLFLFPCLGAGRESTLRIDVERVKAARWPFFVLTHTDMADTEDQIQEVETTLRIKLVPHLSVPPKKIWMLSNKKAPIVDQFHELCAALTALGRQFVDADPGAKAAHSVADLYFRAADAAEQKDNLSPEDRQNVYLLRSKALGCRDLTYLGRRRSHVHLVCPECLKDVQVSSDLIGTERNIYCASCNGSLGISKKQPTGQRPCPHCERPMLSTSPVCHTCGGAVTINLQGVYVQHRDNAERARNAPRQASYILSDKTMERLAAIRQNLGKSAADGNCLILGGPGTGKTVLLACLAKYCQIPSADEILIAPMSREAMEFRDYTYRVLASGQWPARTAGDAQALPFVLRTPFGSCGMQLFDLPGERYYDAFARWQQNPDDPQAQRLRQEVKQSNVAMLLVAAPHVFSRPDHRIDSAWAACEYARFLRQQKHRPKLGLVLTQCDGYYEAIEDAGGLLATARSHLPDLFNLIPSFDVLALSAVGDTVRLGTGGDQIPRGGFQSRGFPELINWLILNFMMGSHRRAKSRGLWGSLFGASE